MNKSLREVNKTLRKMNRTIGDIQTVKSGDKNKMVKRFGGRILGREVIKLFTKK